MIRNHEIIEKIRKNRVILAVGFIAASATLLAGCGAKAEQKTVPLSQLDTSTLSKEDAKQFISVAEAVRAFKDRQTDPDTQLVDGPNDLYTRYIRDPLQGQIFGSGWEQSLTGWAGITTGDQEQVTKINATDAVEEVIRDRAIEIAAVDGKPEDAADIVDRYIDNQGNITKQDVLRQIAEISKQ